MAKILQHMKIPKGDIWDMLIAEHHAKNANLYVA